MRFDFLDPKRPASNRPAADHTVEAVGPCCLDVNVRWAYLAKGRLGLVWWCILCLYAIPVFAAAVYLLSLWTGDEGFEYSSIKEAGLGALGAAVVTDGIFAIGLIYLIHVWRTHLPVRFNRKTREVSVHRRGKTYTCDWDDIKAILWQIRVRTWVDPVIMIYFRRRNDLPLKVILMSNPDDVYSPTSAGPLWEYIRFFMEEGPEKLPPAIPAVEPYQSLHAIREAHDPMAVRAKQWWLWPLEIAFVTPFRVLLWIVKKPTEITYYHLSRRIKMKPFPPEMVAACECDDTDQEPHRIWNKMAPAARSMFYALHFRAGADGETELKEPKRRKKKRRGKRKT